MSIRHIHIFWTIAALLLCAAVSSCSQDEIDVPGGDMFAPDKYPLLLRAYVGQMPSRADAGETVPRAKVILYVFVSTIPLQSLTTLLSASICLTPMAR